MFLDWLAYLDTPALKTLLSALITALLLSIAARSLIRLLERVTRKAPMSREVLSRIKSPLYVLVPLIGLQGVGAGAPDDLPFIGIIRHLLGLALIATMTWLGLQAANSVERIILLRNPIDISDNLRARRIQTQTRVLVRTLGVFVVLFGFAAMLMTFPAARQVGASLLASAGVAGLAVGFAAKPVLGNLIAGLQIALTQPIRLDDVVIVEGEWGRIEEITGAYVVIRIWDERRLVVPLQWFIENPFQNWTRSSASILGSVFFWVDYGLPLDPLRAELQRLCESVPQLWDGRVCVLQVTEAGERAIQLRVLASSPDSSRNWDLRCYLRENLINFIGNQYPDALPRVRASLHMATNNDATDAQQATTPPEHQPPV
ncbi:MAG: mechanosensitive ion channel family protein [Gammaproteobacteria bacterium]|nr:mechanosensitive ion channel family protein [Gammaproteobacteria bacterium]MBU1489557.1 mechanosensitive ion channel family protein [Gammaproteobacteria bacterium]MBU2067824.1 mechanosensitive ion channel family protein [Gammaproteobacteria bacterium]MBU2141007.1 mechanosensitive ion channel family protein [Gammaproteobacteria bacterium]MBU2217362.1 mechanosensitive ion channel family protein [Gammaproteobacteria bacterium]